MLLFHLTDRKTFEQTFKSGFYKPENYKNTKSTKFYNAKEMISIIKNNITPENCDNKMIIIVSTKAFKFHAFQKINENTYILPDKIPANKIHDMLFFEEEDNKIKLLTPAGKTINIEDFFKQYIKK